MEALTVSGAKGMNEHLGGGEIVSPDVQAKLSALVDDWSERIATPSDSPEVELTYEQTKLALLIRVAESATGENGWYATEEQQKTQRNKGIIGDVSEAIGQSTSRTKMACDACEELGLVEVRTAARRTSSRPPTVKNLRLTEFGQAFLSELELAEPGGVGYVREFIDGHVLRRIVQTIEWVRQEINNARQEMGLEPYEFEDVDGLKSIGELNEHLQWLWGQQKEQLGQLGGGATF